LTTNVNYLNAFFTYFSEGQRQEEKTLNRDIADKIFQARPGPIINADAPKGICAL